MGRRGKAAEASHVALLFGTGGGGMRHSASWKGYLKGETATLLLLQKTDNHHHWEKAERERVDNRRLLVGFSSIISSSQAGAYYPGQRSIE